MVTILQLPLPILPFCINRFTVTILQLPFYCYHFTVTILLLPFYSYHVTVTMLLLVLPIRYGLSGFC